MYTPDVLVFRPGGSASETDGGAPLPKAEKRTALAKRDAEHEKFRERWGEKTRLEQDIKRKRREYW